MDEHRLAEALDGFLDGLAAGADDGGAVDPDLARIARRYRALGQSPAPAGARERVWRRILSPGQRSQRGAVGRATQGSVFDVILPAAGPNGRVEEPTGLWPRVWIPAERRRTMSQLAASAVLLLTIAAIVIVLRFVALEQTMMVIDAPRQPAVETLIDATVESSAVDRTPIAVERWTFQPAPATVRIPPLDGPQWLVVDGGRLVATVAGAERTLAMGDSLVVEAGLELVLSNPGQETASALRGVSAVRFSLEEYDRRAVTMQIALDTEAHETLPPGDSRVVFERLTLQPETTQLIEPASGQDWVAVVTGRLGLTLIGEGLPRGWRSGYEREIGTTERLPALVRGTQVSLHNIGEDPLVLLRLRLMPVAEEESAP